MEPIETPPQTDKYGRPLGARDGRNHPIPTAEQYAALKAKFPTKTFFDEDMTYISKGGNRVNAGMLLPFMESHRPEALAKRRENAARRWDIYLKSLAKGKRVSAALKDAGLTFSGLYTHRKADPGFIDLEKRAEQVAAEPVEDALWDAALSGNVPAATKWLEKRAPERWPSDKTIVETKTTLELDVSDRIERLMLLQAQLQQRAELGGGDVIETTALEPGDE